MKLEKVPDIVEACMILHNICIDAKVSAHVRSKTKDWADHGVPALNLQEHYDPDGSLIDTVIPKEEMSKGRRVDLGLGICTETENAVLSFLVMVRA